MRLATVYMPIQRDVQDAIVELVKSYPVQWIDQKLCKLCLGYGISESKSMMVFISLATKEMVRYMSMYSEVCFMNCTAGM